VKPLSESKQDKRSRIGRQEAATNERSRIGIGRQEAATRTNLTVKKTVATWTQNNRLSISKSVS